jgi:preprotein translocase subunit SecF
MENSILRKLNLHGNEITDAGGHAICEYFYEEPRNRILNKISEDMKKKEETGEGKKDSVSTLSGKFGKTLSVEGIKRQINL